MSSFDKFLKVPTKMCKFLGIDLSIESSKRIKWMQIATLMNVVVSTILQILYNITDGNADVENLTYINYYFMAFGKIFSIFYNRVLLANCMDELRLMFPTRNIERKYRLQYYLKHYLRFERFMWTFYVFITLEYMLMPLLQIYLWFQQYNEFSFKMPTDLWRPKSMEKSFLAYGFEYILGCASGFQVASANAGGDIFLISCISQLCLHFDLLAQQIMELQPEENECRVVENLKKITRHHTKILKLATAINKIFGPSMLFSLMSSSFILCFVAYQMLDDLPPIILVKAFAFLLYESKQVIIICYFGNKLIDCSSLINESLYMHNWLDGSLKYKRIILFMLMQTQKPFALNVANIADISLQTLKSVYGNAYRLFTVLKST